MNNEELEKLLRKVVREEVEAEAERTSSENTVQNVRLEGHLMKIEGRMKDLEVSNTHLEKGQERIEQKLDQSIKDTARFFHETWDKMGTTDERITRLEEAADLTHKN